MPAKPSIIIERGEVFGELTVICEVSRKTNNRRFLCKCSCGTPTIVWISNLRLGKTTSCGCVREASLPVGRETVIQNRYHKARISENGRICLTCNTWKPWAEFKTRSNSAFGKASNCRECDKWRNIKMKYGITRAEWDNLFTAQGGLCALCRDEHPRLFVDHNHSHCSETRGCPGCIRGLLCLTCNTMLGHIEKYPHLRALFEFYLDQRPLLHNRILEKAV